MLRIKETGTRDTSYDHRVIIIRLTILTGGTIVGDALVGKGRASDQTTVGQEPGYSSMVRSSCLRNCVISRPQCCQNWSTSQYRGSGHPPPAHNRASGHNLRWPARRGNMERWEFRPRFVRAPPLSVECWRPKFFVIPSRSPLANDISVSAILGSFYTVVAFRVFVNLHTSQ